MLQPESSGSDFCGYEHLSVLLLKEGADLVGKTNTIAHLEVKDFSKGSMKNKKKKEQLQTSQDKPSPVLSALN